MTMTCSMLQASRAGSCSPLLINLVELKGVFGPHLQTQHNIGLMTTQLILPSADVKHLCMHSPRSTALTARASQATAQHVEGYVLPEEPHTASRHSISHMCGSAGYSTRSPQRPSCAAADV